MDYLGSGFSIIKNDDNTYKVVYENDKIVNNFPSAKEAVDFVIDSIIDALNSYREILYKGFE